jgi:hypothetical protein
VEVSDKGAMRPPAGLLRCRHTPATAIRLHPPEDGIPQRSLTRRADRRSTDVHATACGGHDDILPTSRPVIHPSSDGVCVWMAVESLRRDGAMCGESPRGRAGGRPTDAHGTSDGHDDLHPHTDPRPEIPALPFSEPSIGQLNFSRLICYTLSVEPVHGNTWCAGHRIGLDARVFHYSAARVYIQRGCQRGGERLHHVMSAMGLRLRQRLLEHVRPPRRPAAGAPGGLPRVIAQHEAHHAVLA